jgi:3'-5' exoribonuclease
MVSVANNVTVMDVLSSESGCKFSVVVMVREVETKLAKNNTEYLSVTVGDKTGTCSCKIFGSSPVYNFFKTVRAKAIILLDGISREYNGTFSPDVLFAKSLTEEEVSRGNYSQKVILAAAEDVNSLQAELERMIDGIGNERLRATVRCVIANLGGDFYNKAAGILMHHAYRNGLLEHTVHSSRAGMRLLELYPFINRDIALAGLLLHDAGKALEYTDDPVAQKTQIGVLQGHLILGYRLLRQAALQNKLDDEILERLEHVLLSHHNEPDFGAVVRPATPEAVFVALVDNLDAKMGMVEQLLSSTPRKHVFSDFHKGLESKLLVTPISTTDEVD